MLIYDHWPDAFLINSESIKMSLLEIVSIDYFSSPLFLFFFYFPNPSSWQPYEKKCKILNYFFWWGGGDFRDVWYFHMKKPLPPPPYSLHTPSFSQKPYLVDINTMSELNSCQWQGLMQCITIAYNVLMEEREKKKKMPSIFVFCIHYVVKLD